MKVKVQEKESIIVKAMRTMTRRRVHTLPQTITIIHSVNKGTDLFRAISGDNPFLEALGEGRRQAYFRCICPDDNTSFPQIVKEIPVDELRQNMRI